MALFVFEVVMFAAGIIVVCIVSAIYLAMTISPYIKIAIMAIMFPVAAMSWPVVPTVSGSLCTISDPDFSEYRYSEQIAVCKRNVTPERKNKVCKRDGVLDRRDFTVDHLIPLSMGGSNHDDNIWCQHKSINVTALEYEVYVDLRGGALSQKDAIEKVLRAKFKN